MYLPNDLRIDLAGRVKVQTSVHSSSNFTAINPACSVELGGIYVHLHLPFVNDHIQPTPINRQELEMIFSGSIDI
jgi:hypothetical protein